MKIAVVRGDGIGKEVIPQAVRVLQHYAPDAEYFEADIGYGKWERCGVGCDDDDIESLKGADSILFGAVTTPPDPGYKSVMLRIRKDLGLYANLRPVYGEGFNIMVVRENSEGLYSGIEEIGEERSTTLRVVTKKASERIARCACGILLKDFRNGTLTIGNKANVMKSDVLFRDTCISVAQEMGVPYRTAYIDALTFDAIQNPQRYDVIVTTNLFGDILSDALGHLVGGLGMLPSANIGDRHALFEPVHGSAPDIAGKGIANPIAAVRSAGMLLEHNGIRCQEEIEEAIAAVISSGMKTRDLGGTADTVSFANALMDRLSSGG
ncbi:MAG: isocitrate/isopropylmalate family dehydrogenase [Candidatus Methanomethylophilaceae archaeon]